MRVVCKKCNKLFGCYIGKSRANCGDRNCGIARAYEMCQRDEPMKIELLCPICLQEELTMVRLYFKRRNERG